MHFVFVEGEKESNINDIASFPHKQTPDLLQLITESVYFFLICNNFLKNLTMVTSYKLISLLLNKDLADREQELQRYNLLFFLNLYFYIQQSN